MYICGGHWWTASERLGGEGIACFATVLAVMAYMLKSFELFSELRLGCLLVSKDHEDSGQEGGLKAISNFECATTRETGNLWSSMADRLD